MKNKHWLVALFISFIVVSISGCTTSIIAKSHLQYASADSEDHAMVYLVRPMPIRTRGVADNDLEIEIFEDEPVAKLSAGEYVALKLKPGTIDIIIRSKTYLTTNPIPVDVWRARNFEITSGKTYFIHTKFTQEEFRGIYFVPVEIDLATVKNMLNRLKPAGELANQFPIAAL